VDKAVEAVNTLKVLGSLSKMADLLKASAAAAVAAALALGSCTAGCATPALVCLEGCRAGRGWCLAG
jgi:hypothetical protein